MSDRIATEDYADAIIAGGLPSWWEVVSTPGSEEVEFQGIVGVEPTNDAIGTPFYVKAPVGFRDNGTGSGAIYEIRYEDAAPNDVAWKVDSWGNAVQYGAVGQGPAQLTLQSRTAPNNGVIFTSEGDILSTGGGIPLRVSSVDSKVIIRTNLILFTSSEPADANITGTSLVLFYDDTAGAAKLKIKAKDDNGDVVSAEIPLA